MTFPELVDEMSIGLAIGCQRKQGKFPKGFWDKLTYEKLCAIFDEIHAHSPVWYQVLNLLIDKATSASQLTTLLYEPDLPITYEERVVERLHETAPRDMAFDSWRSFHEIICEIITSFEQMADTKLIMASLKELQEESERKMTASAQTPTDICTIATTNPFDSQLRDSALAKLTELAGNFQDAPESEQGQQALEQISSFADTWLQAWQDSQTNGPQLQELLQAVKKALSLFILSYIKWRSGNQDTTKESLLGSLDRMSAILIMHI